MKKSPKQQREQELRQGLALLQRQLVIEQAAAREVVQKHMMAQINTWKADKPKDKPSKTPRRIGRKNTGGEQ